MARRHDFFVVNSLMYIIYKKREKLHLIEKKNGKNLKRRKQMNLCITIA